MEEVFDCIKEIPIKLMENKMDQHAGSKFTD